ncbi:MAG: glycosyltransferase family 39 protein [Bacteroidales bacterium]|nr:glycosyltransferase family 39 protein [Bacteroidales bacterium]
MKNLRVSEWLKEYWVIIAFILAKLLIHFSTNTIYELQRDAFLYSALGEHLAWGYHSVPPSIGVFANISRFLFGDTTFALRFFPTVTGACSILLIGLMVREMGGKKLAQFIACLAFLTAPSFLRSNTLFQPVSFNQFYWLLISFLTFRLIRTNKQQYWLWIGVVSGLAFLNKYSVFTAHSSLLADML